jgi:hypothetical protein
VADPPRQHTRSHSRRPIEAAEIDNIALGSGAGQNLTTGSDNLDIANAGVAADSGRIRIGTAGQQTAAFLQGVYGKTSSGGVSVVINSAGKLGTASAASAKTAGRPLSARAGSRLLAEAKRLEGEVDRLRAARTAG